MGRLRGGGGGGGGRGPVVAEGELEMDSDGGTEELLYNRTSKTASPKKTLPQLSA